MDILRRSFIGVAIGVMICNILHCSEPFLLCANNLGNKSCRCATENVNTVHEPYITSSCSIGLIIVYTLDIILQLAFARIYRVQG